MSSLSIVLAGVLGIACSSSSSGSSSSSCSTTGTKPTFTSITQAAGSGASCPAIAPSDLNSAMTSSDGGSSSCSPVFSNGSCQATFSCPEPGGATVSGTIDASGSSFTGSFSVMAGSVTCNYTFAGTFSG
jgi:hypothetical protein